MDLTRTLLNLFRQKKSDADEEQKILEQGATAQMLVRGPGWPLLLDWFTQEDENALNRLGKVDLTKPLDCQAALIEFRRTRALLIGIQDHIHGLIQAKQSLEEQNRPEKGTIEEVLLNEHSGTAD